MSERLLTVAEVLAYEAGYDARSEEVTAEIARLTAELDAARETLDEAASVLEEQRDEWTLERQPWKRMSDDDVLANMQGSATLDDPPDGWTRRDLAMYSRGYLTAEERQLGNAASTVASVARIIRRALAATPPDTEDDDV